LSLFFLLPYSSPPDISTLSLHDALPILSLRFLFELRGGTVWLPRPKSSLLSDNFLLRCDRAPPRTLPRARIGVRALPAHRQVTTVPDATVALDFDEPADVHLDLFAEIAFHAAFGFNRLTQTVHFL